jgi:hypothetical protein
VVCLAQWRDSSTRGPSYEALSARVADAVKLQQHLDDLAIEDLAEVRTFLSVEKLIASRLRDRVLETASTINPQAIRDIASRRQDGYWVNPALPDASHAPRRALHAVYGNGYLAELALVWNQQLEAGLLGLWRIDGVANQQALYEREIAPVLAKGTDRRVFVIVSDAFRYEAAQELTEQLNGKYRFDAELSAQLGVLPSYTALGMAALLPHHTLGYDASGAVRIDGLPCASLEQRGKILEAVQGVAVKADAFMAMKKDEGPKQAITTITCTPSSCTTPAPPRP